MCGIAGLVSLSHGGSADPSLLEAMLRPIGHRGPDAMGVHVEGPVGLGHVRLSIIDLVSGGQPMSNADGTVWIVFNGEIFNYLELREELVRRGRRFATRSDTEVILHLYEERGEDCVRVLNGQWAFAIWDARIRRLFLSRDRMGVRPLFYTMAGGSLVFASEAKSLFVHPAVSREIDPVGLDQIFTFWTTLPPRTIFRNVGELPPGHSLIAERGTVRVERYWRLAYPGGPDPRGNEGEHAERLLALLADATRIRLRADVPVGAYLSGGLDSSVITALITRFAEARFRTFSVLFDEPEFDERRYQREVARFLGTDHEEVSCSAADIGRVFPDVIWHTEKPVLRTAPAPLFLLSRAVRDSGLKVVLTGEGADEAFGGYDIFKEAKIRRFWAARPESRIRPLLLRRLYPYLEGIQSQPAPYLQAFFHVNPAQRSSPFFSHLPRWELTSRLKLFLSPGVRAESRAATGYPDIEASLPEEYAEWDSFSRAQYLETAYLLPGYILSSQGDRVSMAHAVEGRFPFLDHRVVEFAAATPPRLKMRALNEKYVLKRVAAGMVPAAVVARPKQPYRAPEARSFLRPGATGGLLDYVGELLSPARLRRDGLFDPAPVGKLVEKVLRGQAAGVRDNMAFVGVLSTQLVVDQFLDHFGKRSARGSH